MIEDAQQLADAGTPGSLIMPAYIRAALIGPASTRDQCVAALRVFCAQARALGMTDSVSLYWPDVSSDTDDNRDHGEDFTLEDAATRPAESFPFPIESAHLASGRHWMFEYHETEISDRPAKPKARLAAAHLPGSTALEEAMACAAHLRSIGLMAEARLERRPSEGDDPKVVVYAAALLAEPARDVDEYRYKLAELLARAFGADQDNHPEVPLSILGDMLGRALREHGDSFVAALAQPVERIRQLAEEWKLAGYDRTAFNSMGDRWMASAPSDPEPIVPGLVYQGALHLLAAPFKSGKSSALLELAVKLGSHLDAEASAPTWWGSPIVRPVAGPPLVVFWIGEEMPAIVAQRRRQLLAAGFDSHYVQTRLGGAAELRAYIRQFDKPDTAPKPPYLMIVDTTRVFIVGSEDASENVSEFLDLLRGFVERTNCAAIVSHHLGKNWRPRNLAECMAGIRGSQVWLDRPRLILGMYRSGGVTRAGVCQGNFRDLEKDVAKPFRFDADTCQLLPTVVSSGQVVRAAGSTSAAASDVADTATDERVISAVIDLNRRGVVVTRSGKHNGLFELAHEALAGLGRAAVRAAVERLLADGRLSAEDGGCLYVAASGDQRQPMAAE